MPFVPTTQLFFTHNNLLMTQHFFTYDFFLLLFAENEECDKTLFENLPKVKYKSDVVVVYLLNSVSWFMW